MCCTVGVPSLSDSYEWSVVADSKKSTVFAVVPALNWGREGMQLFRLLLEESVRLIIQVRVVVNIPGGFAPQPFYIVDEKGEQQNVASHLYCWPFIQSRFQRLTKDCYLSVAASDIKSTTRCFPLEKKSIIYSKTTYHLRTWWKEYCGHRHTLGVAHRLILLAEGLALSIPRACYQ